MFGESFKGQVEKSTAHLSSLLAECKLKRFSASRQLVHHLYDVVANCC